MPAHHATRPLQVWSCNITYLKSPVRGVFWYLYLIMDIWSRRIMGWAVHPTQRDAHAATLFTAACHEPAVSPAGLVLQADDGSPMKGATMLVTLERLGVIPSFSRPRVRNDRPYSEALFRTRKVCPAFPTQSFVDLNAARAWVAAFVTWYNHQHPHSAMQFVTPDDRHVGRDIAILEQRAAVYQAARAPPGTLARQHARLVAHDDGVLERCTVRDRGRRREIELHRTTILTLTPPAVSVIGGRPSIHMRTSFTGRHGSFVITDTWRCTKMKDGEVSHSRRRDRRAHLYHAQRSRVPRQLGGDVDRHRWPRTIHPHAG